MKMDYEEMALFYISKLNRMHEHPESFNELTYRHNAVLCNLYCILVEKELINNEIHTKKRT